MTRKYLVVVIIFSLPACQKLPDAPASAGHDERPIRVSVCELTKNPEAYNHRLVAVEGELSQGNEEFSLYSKDSPSCGAVWLDIGGKSVSGTVYCCGGNQGYLGTANLTVDGIEIPLSEDDETKSAVQRIQVRARADYNSSDVNFIGRFFAGGRYGHFGVSNTLLVIQRVLMLRP